MRLTASARKLQTATSAAWMRAYVPAWPIGGPALDTRAYAEAWSQGTVENLGSAVAYALEAPAPPDLAAWHRAAARR